MGGGPSKLELAQAEQDKALEEKRKAQLEKAREDAGKDRVYLKITEPRVGKNGNKVGKPLFEYEGTDEGANYAMQIAQTNKEAIKNEAKHRAINDS